jgi:hypothetical protein
MTATVIDSRAWTGDIPDYRAKFRRLLFGRCFEMPGFVVAVHSHSALSSPQKAAVVAMLKEQQP